MTRSIQSSVRSLATRRSVLAGAATAGALGLAIDAFAGNLSTGLAPPVRAARRTTLAADRLPIEGRLPSLAGATAWFNSAPLTPAGLKGKTILVEFWTYTCINWRRQFRYVRAWVEKYGNEGLVVIGVHTPEFDFEHDLDNVRRAAKEISVTFPIAVDSGYAIWDAFNNEAWPALYFVDTQGRIRHRFYGEGNYEQSEHIIQQLLTEVGAKDVSHDLASVHADGVEVAADWPNLKSPESYLGYDQAENFASPGGALVGKPRGYTVPDGLQRNQWGLFGDWIVGNRAVLLNGSNGRIRYRFHVPATLTSSWRHPPRIGLLASASLSMAPHRMVRSVLMQIPRDGAPSINRGFINSSGNPARSWIGLSRSNFSIPSYAPMTLLSDRWQVGVTSES